MTGKGAEIGSRQDHVSEFGLTTQNADMDNSAFIMKSQTSVQIQNWKQKVAKTKATMRSTNITQAAFKDYEDDDEEEPELELLRQDYAVSHNDG